MQKVVLHSGRVLPEHIYAGLNQRLDNLSHEDPTLYRQLCEWVEYCSRNGSAYASGPEGRYDFTLGIFGNAQNKMQAIRHLTNRGLMDHDLPSISTQAVMMHRMTLG